jgi:hypothetical protein
MRWETQITSLLTTCIFKSFREFLIEQINQHFYFIEKLESSTFAKGLEWTSVEKKSLLQKIAKVDSMFC